MSQSDQCITCQHYLAAKICVAFPEGIPDPIFFGEHDHRTEYPGDNGIRYELIETYREDDDIVDDDG